MLVTGVPDGLKSVPLSVSYLMILEYPIHFLKNMDHTLFNCIIPRRFDHLVSQLPKDWSSFGVVQLNVSHKQIMFRIDERPYNLVGINSADLLLLSFYNPLLLWSSIIVLRQKPEPLTRGLCVYIIYQYKKRIKKCLFYGQLLFIVSNKVSQNVQNRERSHGRGPRCCRWRLQRHLWSGKRIALRGAVECFHQNAQSSWPTRDVAILRWLGDSWLGTPSNTS